MPFSVDDAAPLLSLIPFSLLEPDSDFGFGFTPWPDPTPPPSDQTGAKTEPETSLSPPEPDRAPPSPAEERRLRRMISNRESARRSRMRKKRHLEELRSLLAGLRAENREHAARLAGAAQLSALLRRDSDRLRAESASLRRRLESARRVLIFRRLLAQSPPFSVGSNPSVPHHLERNTWGQHFGLVEPSYVNFKQR